MVERLTHKRPDGRAVANAADMDFFKRQKKIVLRNCGQIDPQRIEDYIARDGYQALAKTLAENDAQPRYTNNQVRQARIAATYREDEGKRLRKSHDNPDIARLYEEFLGRPLGERSHSLLHTQYTPRSRV